MAEVGVFAVKPFGYRLNNYHDVADQLRAHLVQRASQAFAQAAAEKAALTSVEAIQERHRRLRQETLAALGGLPELPGTVSATCTGVITGREFNIEKLLIETLPAVYVSANLYLPRQATYAVPGVLFLCGHERSGKAAERYQLVCRALVRANMAVLAIDPVGQGERIQYIDPASGKELVPWGVAEHSYAGFQCHVAGFGIARYFIADAIQALTYLAARPEVDPTRLGVTGNSGGGTQTSYLTFLDDRITCSAPCTYITSRERWLLTSKPHDSEQNFYRAIAMGLDYDDLLAGHAPKPLLIGAVASDFFPIEGTLAGYANLHRTYKLHGALDKLYCVVAPGTHSFSPVLRDLVTRFMRRHLLGEDVDLSPGLTVYAAADEAPIGSAAGLDVSVAWETPRRPSGPRALYPGEDEALPPEALQVTKSGQIAHDYPAAKSVFALNLESWRSKEQQRSDPPEIRAKEKWRRLEQAVLGSRPRPPLWVRGFLTNVDPATGVTWTYRFMFSEPDIAVPMIELRSEAWTQRGEHADTIAVIALTAGTNAVDAQRDTVLRLVLQHGRVLLFDPRGSGAAAQRPIGDMPDQDYYGTPYTVNYNAMMLGDSLFAMQVFDAMRVLEYARRVAPRVQVVGEGVPGLVLLAAAALDRQVAGGRFTQLPRSFTDIVTNRFYQADYRLEVFGLLDWPDIPELLSAIPAVEVAEPLDLAAQPATNTLRNRNDTSGRVRS